MINNIINIIIHIDKKRFCKLLNVLFAIQKPIKYEIVKQKKTMLDVE